MTEPTDLIERMRADAASSREGYQAVVYVRTLAQAADEITALRDRVAALEGVLESIAQHKRKLSSYQCQLMARSILSRA